jgi:hypothetical protein
LRDALDYIGETRKDEAICHIVWKSPSIPDGHWTLAHKDSGSRQNGWEPLRERLKNVTKPEGPRLLVFNTCRQFIRTVPVVPRDEIDMEDVDTAAGDHVGGWDWDFGMREEAGSAAAPGVAFPAEQGDLES